MLRVGNGEAWSGMMDVHHVHDAIVENTESILFFLFWLLISSIKLINAESRSPNVNSEFRTNIFFL